MFHSMHSPRGANGSFVVGANGDSGGFMHNMAFIPENEVYVGVRHKNVLCCLPFFQCDTVADPEAAFDFSDERARKTIVQTLSPESIKRTLRWATDTFETPDFSFCITTPVDGIQDPEKAQENSLKLSVLPAITARFTVTNKYDEPVLGFFGTQGLRGVYPMSEASEGALLGAAGVDGYGFALDAQKYGDFVTELADFGPSGALNRNTIGFYRNCAMGGFYFMVNPGESATVEFALGWFEGSLATRGLHKMPYYYTRFYTSLEDVLAFAVANIGALNTEAADWDAKLEKMPINAQRKFFVAQSTRCYWASSMLFLQDGIYPRYVVNEGSYMMMNTFDLSVDHLFFECMHQPWTVKNQLDSFSNEYCYTDTLVGEDGKLSAGGVSFTHDQGSFGTFSPKGFSSYEMGGKEGCLSYMTQEQLVNWLLSAAVYAEFSGDDAWVCAQLPLVEKCLISMQNRDNPNSEKRDGIMDFDSSRCEGMWEITTYDSLDTSLGQARRNLYLAGKCWAAYLAIYRLLRGAEGYEKIAASALSSAQLCAKTLCAWFDPSIGYIPAILESGNKQAIIPALEGLVYPWMFGMRKAVQPGGGFDDLIRCMKNHFGGVFKTGVCRFEDGGWRLSAGSINSWVSKIFVSQFIAETILGVDRGDTPESADIAHEKWWKVQCARCPGIDQIRYQQEYSRGFHYPRAITSILWTLERD